MGISPEFKLAGGCGFFLLEMLAPNWIVATTVAIAGSGSLAWGMWDFMNTIKIRRAEGRGDSATSKDYDQSVKRVVLGVISLFFIISALSFYGIFF